MPLVLSGEKDITWRLFDDKALAAGDDIELQEYVSKKPFAYGRITKVAEKPFGELIKEDKQGHEAFKDDAEMYAQYTEYYKTPVDVYTIVKVAWFELIPNPDKTALL